MDQQSSEPTTISTVVYESDGSVVMKQEPQNDSSQMDVTDNCGLSDKVMNIAPILDNNNKICKIEDVCSIKREYHHKWCELYETSHHSAIKSENDLNVCDCNQDSILVYRDMSLKMELKTESIQTDDSSSQPIEVSGATDCMDGISSNVTAGICGSSVNQSDEEQSDAAQQQPPCQSTDEIQTEGM